MLFRSGAAQFREENARRHRERLSAIQLTTAAGVVAVLELFARGALPKGFAKQESITLPQFLGTQWGGKIYGGNAG